MKGRGALGPQIRGCPLALLPFSRYCPCLASPQDSLPSASGKSASCQLFHNTGRIIKARLYSLLAGKKPSALPGSSVRALSKRDVTYCLEGSFVSPWEAG